MLEQISSNALDIQDSTNSKQLALLHTHASVLADLICKCPKICGKLPDDMKPNFRFTPSLFLAICNMDKIGKLDIAHLTICFINNLCNEFSVHHSLPSLLPKISLAQCPILGRMAQCCLLFRTGVLFLPILDRLEMCHIW